MNDNDIIKALECCQAGKGSYSCKKCPLFCRIPACQSHLAEAALDLINRQKTEIERLKWERDSALKLFEANREVEQREHNSLIKELKTINSMIPATLSRVKAEAIKEFAERLKDAVDEPTKIDGEDIDFIIDIIDSRVKEMTEGKDVEK